MDHLGAGREWDLTRKRGGLNIVPPFAERSVKMYSGRVDALDSILNWLEAQKERYVILSDSYIAMNFDFGSLIDAHVASGADVTMVYNRAPIPEGARSDNYTIRIDETGRVQEILSNDYRMGEQNLAMNIYVIERESLIHLIHDAAVRGLVYFERDILARNLKLLNVQAYEFKGYAARVSDMKSYFDENMRLLQDGSMTPCSDRLLSTPRSVTITPPAMWQAAPSRTACWLMAASSRAPSRTACCSAAARSRRVLSSKTAS